MNALVANAKSPSSLAVIRSLGKQGIEITAASDSSDDFPLWSKYCRHKLLLKTPPEDSEGRINELLGIVERNRYDVFLPVMSENLLQALAKRKSDFEKHTVLTLPDYRHLEILNDKAKVAALMDELGIPHPFTFLPGTDNFPGRLSENLTFPVILKPFRGEGAKGVKIIYRQEDLENSYADLTKAYGPVLIQELVEGTKHTAVFLLNKNSEVRRFFVHRAIREYPVTGGPTCFLESVKYDPVFEPGLKLLKHIGFTGLAGMEFIIDRKDGIPKIIDVNPRFYGPVQCAISAGADLPHAFYKMVHDGDVGINLDYKTGITCRNLLFDDTKHLLSVLRGVKSPKYRNGRLTALISYLNFSGDDSYFILSLKDPMPALKKLFRF